MEDKIYIRKIEFTEKDVDLLTYQLVPKIQKNVFYACLIFLFMIPIMPYLPAKGTHTALIQAMSYGNALCVFSVLNGLVIGGIYYFGIIRLNREINEGFKFRYQTKILRKTWKGNNKFEIELSERPKKLTEKIIVHKADFYNWFKGDLLEIEFLPRTGIILGYEKIDGR